MKKLLSLLLAALTVFSLCACGSGSYDAAQSAPQAVGMKNEAAMEEAGFGMYADTPAEEEAPAPEAQENEKPEIDPEKIIYSAEITVETTEFDSGVEKLSALIKECGGYMGSSSVNDAGFYSKSRGDGGCRNAYYTIRVPSAAFNDMSGSLSELGNVPYRYTYTENVSAQYYDTEARLKAYSAKEARLIEMLDTAESVEDIIAIESELADVRYEIESLQSMLKNWDRRISYSTIYLSLNEVREYTDSPQPAMSYGQRLWHSLKTGLRNVGRFFRELLVWLVGVLPTIAVIAVLIIILRPAYKKLRAKRKAKKAARTEKKAENK